MVSGLLFLETSFKHSIEDYDHKMEQQISHSGDEGSDAAMPPQRQTSKSGDITGNELDTKMGDSSAGDCHAMSSSNAHADEIAFIRRRLEQLESRNQGESRPPNPHGGENSHLPAVPGSLEYQKMEMLMYKDRKEWQTSGDRRWRMRCDYVYDENRNKVYRPQYTQQRFRNMGPDLEHDISDLAHRIKADTEEGTIPPESHDARDARDTEASQPLPLPGSRGYQKMEDCLYRHRKEWEDSADTKWYMDEVPDYSELRADGYYPFQSDYVLKHENPYPQPDPFDAAHKCKGRMDEETEPDEYDRAIDFGSRRERLRKGFEWELDRLYLMEELGNRRRTQKDEKLKKEKADAEAAQKDKDAGSTSIVIIEPQIKRMDWYAFRRILALKSRPNTIDILIGEPIIRDSLLGYGSWFGYSNVASKKPKRTQGTVSATARSPEDSPLPERIRVHSAPLLKIMSKILGSDGSSLEGDTPAVFLRPFKALMFCEEQLRRGYTELEKKYTVSADALVAEGIERDTSDDLKPPTRTRTVVEVQEKTESPSVLGSAIEDMEEDDEFYEGEDEDDEEENEEENENDEKPDEETGSLTTLKHLRCLLQFIDEDIKPKRDYLQRFESRKAFFSDLWYIFRPGMDVISNDGKQAYRVIQVKSARHRVIPQWKRFQSNGDDNEGKKPEAPFSLHCVYIDFDGKNLGPVSRIFEFKRFDGQQDITSLEVYPLKFYQGMRSEFNDEEWQSMDGLPPSSRGDRYRQKLIERGRKFLDVVGVKHMYYAGPTVGVRDEVESQVVIDFETAFAVEDEEQAKWKPTLELLVGRAAEEADEEDKNCSANCCRADQVHDDTYIDNKQRTDYIDSLLPKENEAEKPLLSIIPRSFKELRNGASKSFAISEDEFAIMSYRVFGFVLRTRKWAKLDLSYLTNVQQPEAQNLAEKDLKSGEDQQDSKTAFERLVLEEKHKDMIISLVSQHFRDKGSAANHREQFDIVRGKGKGLIILLHGEPGVGKTSTAEGVAEQFRKPLFQITCGDLGTTSKEVEKALETTFALANRWDCILLLDEADVFLSRRTKEDFQRNGLVAVFLRVMEYYAGILFLTTNRVGDFDEAFTSRIHVSLWYKPLDDMKTVNIFKLNLELIKDRFTRKGRKIVIEDVEIGAFALKHYSEHKSARWNGRQIRNACQTALALAEYDSQELSQKSPEAPDVTVRLGVSHFEVVRDAYVEFTSYIDELYGTDASKRAHEEKLRTAKPVNHSHNIPSQSGPDFAQMARGQMSTHAHLPAQYSNPDFQAMSRPAMTSQLQNYALGGYSNTGQPMYSGYPQPPAQERPGMGDDWNPRGPMPAAAPDTQDPMRYQSSPRAPGQVQRPLTPDSRSRVVHGVEAMYEGTMSQGHAHESPRPFAPYGRGHGP